MAEIFLPPGVDRDHVRRPDPGEMTRGMIVNESGLPNPLVRDFVATYVEEHASVLGVSGGSSFSTYGGVVQGSLLARSNYRVPQGVIEEIQLARDLAERDDDVAETIGAMISTALEDGLQHVHEDEVTLALFEKLGAKAKLEGVFAELYREWLIAASVCTATVWINEGLQILPEGADRQRTRQVRVPLIGILPAEQIRIVGNDLFKTGVLAYRPATASQEMWLREYFSSSTSAGRKAQMREQDKVLATLIVEQLDIRDDEPRFAEEGDDVNLGDSLYRLNPRLVHRTTFPKGAWKYPRPMLTGNFALLEAKRLLNIMDYALLQGGANFLVVAKKGTDQKPAMPEEVDNLREVLRRSSHTGVVIGDHRLDIEIITPDLEELLNPEKRRLLGRKLAARLLRIPELDDEAGAEGMKMSVELVSRTITWDRRQLRRHVEDNIYEEAVSRNRESFARGAASIWFPKIILQGTQYFTDYVLKARDRGDISRRRAVEAGGFDYRAEVQQRRRELESGDDEIMQPAAVPFSSPETGPQDNNSGRPPGSSPDNGAPGSRTREGPARVRPSRVVQRNRGETVRAFFDDDEGTYRAGELTHAVLEMYPERDVGRLTAFEQRALRMIHAEGNPGPMREGPAAVVPVNLGIEFDGDFRAVRLAKGLSMILGYRAVDHAMVARAFCFREPEYRLLDGEEHALTWGFETRPELESGE